MAQTTKGCMATSLGTLMLLIRWSSRSQDRGSDQDEGIDGSCSSPEPGAN